MTKSGEISSTKSEIITVLNEVKSAFSEITGEDKWQGDSMEGIQLKIEKFVDEATSILQSKLTVLSNFAQKFEQFENMSKQTKTIRTQRHQHCKVGHSCGNGCCCPPTIDEDGNSVCVWTPKSCYTGPKAQVEQNVQQMNQMHSEGAAIKSGFPSAAVPRGEGIEPFYDY